MPRGGILLPEARGETDMLLRTAFEVRELAYVIWCLELLPIILDRMRRIQLRRGSCGRPLA